MPAEQATQEHEQSHEDPTTTNLTPPNTRSPVRMVVQHFEKLTAQANTSLISSSRAVISAFVPVSYPRPIRSPPTSAANYSTTATSPFPHPVSSSLPANSSSTCASSSSASTETISAPARSPSSPVYTSSNTLNIIVGVSATSPPPPTAASDTPGGHLSTSAISPKTHTKFLEESITDAMNTQLNLPKRKLVSVRRISSINKIPGYNSRQFHIDGWTVIDNNRDHKVGDLVVFFEIDCFIPIEGRFWDLAAGKSCSFNGKTGKHVKSWWLKGHLCQGLIYPLRHFNDIWAEYQEECAAVGLEQATENLLSRSYAERLGVEKWELDDKNAGLDNLGEPPGFLYMPAWWRIQDIDKKAFSHWRNKVWQVTEKLDGLTMTVYRVSKASNWGEQVGALPATVPDTMQDGGFRLVVCDRRRDYVDRPGNVFWETARASGVLAKLDRFGISNLAIQGELVGETILCNTMKYPKGVHEFLVFGIWDIDAKKYMAPKAAETLCRHLGIKHVPVVDYAPLIKFGNNASELLKKAEGLGQFGGLREGFIFKSLDGVEQFKVISNSWLRMTGKNAGEMW